MQVYIRYEDQEQTPFGMP